MKTNYFRILSLVIILIASGTLWSQKPPKIRTSKVNVNALPKEVSYSGYVVYSARWKDKAGEHVFIATETGVTNTTDSSGSILKNALFTAKHYLINDSTTLTWTESDSVMNCAHTLQAGFVQSQFNITDMDKDGVAEVWMMLKTACHSDVSPANLQLVIREREQRYTMIGTEKTRLSKNDVIGGEFTINNDFREGQELFLNKAKNVWHTYGKNI